MESTRLTAVITTALAAVLALSPSVTGQNALDSGSNRVLDSRYGKSSNANALDNSYRVGSNRANDPAVAIDFQSRNLLVTGDVAGGRGFRGSVGYSAADDFRGRVGSDSSQAFRNDSLKSDLYYLLTTKGDDRYAMAGANGLVEARRDFVSPQTVAGAELLATRGYAGGSPLASSAAADSRIRLDRASTALSATALLRDGTTAVTYGVARGADGNTYKVVAGSLRGVSLVHQDDLIEMLGLGLRESTRLKDEFRSLNGNPREFLAVFPTPFDPSLGSSRIDGSVNRSGSVATGSAAHRRYTREYAEVLESMRTRASTLRAGRADATSVVAAGGSTAGGAVDNNDEWIGTGLARLRDRMSGTDMGGAVARGESNTSGAPTPEEMLLLLQHGRSVSALESSSSAHVAELLAFGTEEMRRGRPFAAEKFYTLAAGIAPRDPMPIAGVANAQISAGLSLTASSSLAMLFRQSPEMIDVRYEAGLLGSTDSLRGTAAAAAAAAAGSPEEGAAHGLVIAYIGHQLADPALVEQGLALIERDPSSKAFLDVIGPIWRQPATVPEPMPPPTP